MEHVAPATWTYIKTLLYNITITRNLIENEAYLRKFADIVFFKHSQSFDAQKLPTFMHDNFYKSDINLLQSESNFIMQ